MTQENNSAANEKRLPVSVNVLTYNASWERVRATLNSVILQKGIDFELIVADDASQENHFEKMRDFFSRHSFTNYKLIAHEKNVGTVRNSIDAAKNSSGIYIRGIGQGDMFFDEYTLRDSYNYISKNHSVAMGSKAVFFEAFSNPIKLIRHHRYPQNIEAYKNPDALRENYLLNNDNLSGATLMYERETLLAYFTEAAEKGVTLVEDFTLKLMVFDKKKISFFKRNTVYYELGIGVSNAFHKMSKKIQEAISSDIRIIDDMLIERCKSSPSDFSERLIRLIDAKRTKKQEASQNTSQEKTEIPYTPSLKRKIINKIKIFVEKVKVLEFLSQILRNRFSKIKTTEMYVSTDFANLCINRE